MEIENNYGQEKRIELILEMHLKKINTNIDELKQKIVQLERKIEERKVEPRQETPKPQEFRPEIQSSHEEQVPLSNAVPQEIKPITAQNPVYEQPKPVPVQNKPVTPVNERIGGFTPGDISIEKFFYAGRL